jgi:hypothetical protein
LRSTGALRISTDELLGVKTPKVERIHDDSEARRTWKRFQMVATLPERIERIERIERDSQNRRGVKIGDPCRRLRPLWIV